MYKILWKKLKFSLIITYLYIYIFSLLKNFWW
jgi:hypothetical protein